MDFDELLNKYLLLKEENQKLRKTIERLKSMHDKGLPEINDNSLQTEQKSFNFNEAPVVQNIDGPKTITKYSSSSDKIELYMSLFRGAKMFMPKDGKTKNYKLRAILRPVAMNGRQAYV